MWAQRHSPVGVSAAEHDGTEWLHTGESPRALRRLSDMAAHTPSCVTPSTLAAAFGLSLAASLRHSTARVERMSRPRLRQPTGYLCKALSRTRGAAHFAPRGPHVCGGTRSTEVADQRTLTFQRPEHASGRLESNDRTLVAIHVARIRLTVRCQSVPRAADHFSARP